jgi:hypothetical protein
MSRPSAVAGRGTPQVSVDDLEPGMLLAEEVRDQQGRLLMPAGTELTERHLRAFQLWGILSVRIRAADAAPDPAAVPLSPEQLAEGEALVLARLRETDPAHPLIVELVRWCAEREARRLAAERQHG